MNTYAKEHDGTKFANEFGALAREVREIATNFIE